MELLVVVDILHFVLPIDHLGYFRPALVDKHIVAELQLVDVVVVAVVIELVEPTTTQTNEPCVKKVSNEIVSFANEVKNVAINVSALQPNKLMADFKLCFFHWSSD